MSSLWALDCRNVVHSGGTSRNVVHSGGYKQKCCTQWGYKDYNLYLKGK